MKHNIKTYKKLGLKKFYFSPISSKDFTHIPIETANKSNFSRKVNETTLFNQLDEASKKSILSFEENGYAIIHNFLSHDTIDKMNSEVDHLFKTKTVYFKFGNRIMDAIHKSSFLKNIGNDTGLLELLSCLLKDEAKLFQSINFYMGSEQKTHSDSIHMTTFPLGGLLGVWIPLEDIDTTNGPLHYYPKSHLMPYYLNSEYNNEGNYFMSAPKDYTEYEKMIEHKILDLPLEKKQFLPKKGDLLIWHANLLHGGDKHIDKNRTRKSMVLHYFAQNSVCYHEITQRPALFNN